MEKCPHCREPVETLLVSQVFVRNGVYVINDQEFQMELPEPFPGEEHLYCPKCSEELSDVDALIRLDD